MSDLELVVSGATVVGAERDPSVMDVGIAAGRIAAIAPELPATVPLMPSWASNTVPLSLRPAQVASSGWRNSRKSGSATN